MTSRRDAIDRPLADHVEHRIVFRRAQTVRMLPSEAIMGAIESIKSAVGKALRPARGKETGLAMHGLGVLPDIRVASSAFRPGGQIPKRYAGDGENVSPALFWDVPRETASFAILCEDPDAPTPEPFVHWVVYGVARTTAQLREGVGETATGFVQGKNSYGHRRFDGPAPPPGHGVHHYHFQIFALDAELALGGAADRSDVVEAMRGHVLAAGDLIGTYER